MNSFPRTFEIFDISPPLNSETAVFPGDQKFERTVSLSFEKGHHLELSSICTTLHIGAHADAPSHYASSGVSVEKLTLEPYVGPCQVVEVQKASGQGGRILPSDLDSGAITLPRVLFKTMSFPNPFLWNDDFWSLHPDLVRELKMRGVILIGMDTPSVDPAHDKVLESHTEIFASGLRILEGLDLSQVQQGEYFLSAAPLKISGADAAPVRALLLRA